MLCPQFAVIRQGKLVAKTTPSAARAKLEGHLYEGAVSTAELERWQQSGRVTRAYLVEGVHQVRLHLPEEAVPEGFVRVAPTLEDAYFTLMHEAQGGAA